MHPASLRLISCSWPRPVASHGRRWISEPEWNAPAMASVPACHTWTLDGRPTLAIDWRTFFAEGVPSPGWHLPGEMKEFHLVFRMRAERSGTLVFHDDDGSIIRRNGVIVHEDREVHPMQRHELPVRAGDTLEIAQWQFHADWVWADGSNRAANCRRRRRAVRSVSRRRVPRARTAERSGAQERTSRDRIQSARPSPFTAWSSMATARQASRSTVNISGTRTVAGPSNGCCHLRRSSRHRRSWPRYASSALRWCRSLSQCGRR